MSVTNGKLVILSTGMYQLSDMQNDYSPGPVTQAACRWLLSGGIPGAYDGPDPGPGHDLSTLLSREFGRRDLDLYASGQWFRREQMLKPVLERIAGERVTAWAMKGFDLARSVYPFPGGRLMSDADLFVSRSDQHRILRAFELEGWSRGSPGDGIFASGIVSEMKMYRLGEIVEIHTHIFYFPATFPGKLPEDLFENGRYLEPGLMGFAWHNALLMVLLHMLTNSRIRPVWWLDVCLLCGRISEAGTWSDFARNADLTELAGSIAGVLSIASGTLNAPVPAGLADALKSSASGREDVLASLMRGRKSPTLLNLRHLKGWKKVSWFFALLWLVLSGQRPLRKTRQ